MLKLHDVRFNQGMFIVGATGEILNF